MEEVFIGLSGPNAFGMMEFTILNRSDNVILSGKVNNMGLELLKQIDNIVWPNENNDIY